jgi:sulfite exporter TauE/SafE
MHILEIIGECTQRLSLTHGLILSLFIAGLVGSLSHCVAMCGPFVISQTGRIDKLRHASLIPYHFGRIVTYTILAVLLSSILNIVFLYLPIRAYIIAPILMLAGLIFFMNAFPKLGKILKILFPWVVSLHTFAPVHSISRLYQKLQNLKWVNLRQFLMGILLGFMPCGLATSALMASATAPSPLNAGMAMAAFGVGTMPALMITGFAGHSLQIKYPHIMPRVTQAMMAWSGIWLFVMAGIILI